MLDFLRKNASSWFSKAILGFIALIFALYFGFSGGGAPMGGTAPIAKVNGQSIPSGLFNQMVQQQLDFYQKIKTGNSPADFQKVIQAQVLQRLISETLLAQEANQLGLRITDVALAKAIRATPSFRQDGQFNENFYLKQFKPYYERQNGQNFEYSLREDLLKDRLRQVINQANIVSTFQLENSLKVRDTQLKISKLEVPFSADGKAITQEKAKQIVSTWIEAKKNQTPTEKLLKDNSLKVSEVGPKSLQSLAAFFGKDSLPVLFCLIELTPGKVCEQPFTIGNQIIAVELLEKTQTSADENQQKQMEQQLVRAKQNQIFTGVNSLLTRQAKIETFLEK